MDQPVGQKSKTRTFKVLRENGKVHIEEKKNNINSIASEFFPPFVVSASTPAEPKKRVFKVASSTVASSEVPVAPSLAVPLAAPTLALQGDGKKVEEEKLPEGENVEPNKPVLQMEKKECDELFDPCTKEPIASLEALEKRIRDIKKQRDIVPVGLYGLTNDTSNYDFLTKVFIDSKVSLDDMVSFRLSAGGQEGSDI